jgi:sugar phosphate isomerase/epimerase
MRTNENPAVSMSDSLSKSMKPRLRSNDLVLCSGTIRSAPFDVTVEAAASAGFQGISLYYDEYVAAKASGWSDDDMRRLLDDQGLAVAELGGRMDWLPGDTGATTIDEFVTTAGAVGARSITVLETRGRTVGDVITFTTAAKAFAEVCDRASEYGLLAHIEYFPVSGIRDLGSAYEIVRRAERANGGVMVDLWHHLRGPDKGRLDPGFPGASILAVQIGDIAASRQVDLMDEMLHHRMLPGEGVGDLATLIRTLRKLGCSAPMEVEVHSDDLAALDPIVAARRAGDALRAVLDNAKRSQ